MNHNPKIGPLGMLSMITIIKYCTHMVKLRFKEVNAFYRKELDNNKTVEEDQTLTLKFSCSSC